jgi:uncharacterized protein (DUF433 family)
MNERISIDPAVQHGRPVIKGTRVPVVVILGSIAGAMSREEIMREYHVTNEDITAALEYACELVAEEQHHPLPTT